MDAADGHAAGPLDEGGRPPVRLVQISDTHLSHLGGVATRNLERVISFVNEVLAPDLVVHTGDIICLTPDLDEDRRAALAALGGFEAPVRFLPGNHDVGEPGDAPWMGIEVTSRWVADHRARFGPDRFAEALGGWTLLGINAELLGSGLEEEQAQWAWLAAVLDEDHDRPTALFSHKPLWAPRAGEGAARSDLDAARERLLSLPGARMLRAIGSGHLHRYRRRTRPGLLEVWAPSTAYRGRTEAEATHFEQLGVVEWRLGASDAEAWFRAPADLDERELADVPELATGIARLAADQVGP